MTTRKEYVEQLMQMAENGHRWRLANADREARVVFSYPTSVALIAPISEAIENNFVSVNEAGLELVKALWPWEGDREPTVLMVRAALEIPMATENPNPLPKSVCSTCGYETDTSTSLTSNHRPRPGDICLCLKCGEVGEFDDDLRVKKATLETMTALTPEQFTDISLAQKLIREKRYVK